MQQGVWASEFFSFLNVAFAASFCVAKSITPSTPFPNLISGRFMLLVFLVLGCGKGVISLCHRPQASIEYYMRPIEIPEGVSYILLCIICELPTLIVQFGIFFFFVHEVLIGTSPSLFDIARFSLKQRDVSRRVPITRNLAHGHCRILGEEDDRASHHVSTIRRR